MAEHHTGPVETGASMDYREHEQTYKMFLVGAKYGTLGVVGLLVGMLAGFFGHAGLLGGFLVMIIAIAIGALLLR